MENIREVVERLPLLKDPHTEFVLLRSCLSLPKIMFMLRSVNTIDHQEPLLQFDSIIRGALSAILGSPLTDDQWCQASLPTAMGGLGLRCAVDHAPVAHAVSLIAAQPLLDGLLGEDVEEFSLPQPLLDTISAQIGEDTTVETLTGVSQKKASLKVDILKKSLLLQRISEGGDVREIARMASLGLPHAGSWLSVVPSPSLGLHLRPAEFVPILKYRLGIPVYTSGGTCPACSSPSDRMGDHSLGCVKTGDRIARHNFLRDILFETAASADLAPTKEEKYLLPGTIARPGDVTIRRWVNGKDGAIDVTVTSPLSPSNVKCAAAEPGGALDKAYQRKVKDTAEACRLEGIVFLPFAVESLGGFHSGAVAQVRQLAAVLARCKGVEEGEVTSQIFGRLSLALMRANAAMISSRCQDLDFPPAIVDGME